MCHYLSAEIETRLLSQLFEWQPDSLRAVILKRGLIIRAPHFTLDQMIMTHYC